MTPSLTRPVRNAAVTRLVRAIIDFKEYIINIKTEIECCHDFIQEQVQILTENIDTVLRAFSNMDLEQTTPRGPIKESKGTAVPPPPSFQGDVSLVNPLDAKQQTMAVSILPEPVDPEVSVTPNSEKNPKTTSKHVGSSRVKRESSKIVNSVSVKLDLMDPTLIKQTVPVKSTLLKSPAPVKHAVAKSPVPVRSAPLKAPVSVKPVPVKRHVPVQAAVPLKSPEIVKSTILAVPVKSARLKSPVPVKSAPLKPSVTVKSDPLKPSVPEKSAPIIPPLHVKSASLKSPVARKTRNLKPHVPVKSSSIIPPVSMKSSSIIPPLPVKSLKLKPPVPAKSASLIPPLPGKLATLKPPVPVKSASLIPPLPVKLATLKPSVPDKTSSLIPPLPVKSETKKLVPTNSLHAFHSLQNRSTRKSTEIIWTTTPKARDVTASSIALQASRRRSIGPHVYRLVRVFNDGQPEYVTLQGLSQLSTPLSWHHGAISRERAEALLSSSPDGVFLVRESTNFPGDHTLCVRFRGRVEHYRVKWATVPDSQTQRLTIDDEEFFDNMTDLIHHYLKDADGLCTKLVRCLPKAAPNGTNPLQPPYPPHPQQPPPYPPTPPVPAPHFAPAPAPAPAYAQPPQDTVDAAKFLDARWIINERDLEIRENIGKGEFGDVMLGILNGNLKVAVKILKDREAASKFRAEASVMASLKHENLVRLLGLVFSASGTCLVTEHCAQGSLLDYLRSRGRHYVTQRDQINFAYDTCCGMEYLERQRVVHRDLAARNVLVSAEGTAKVADFGLARTDLAPDDPADALRLQAKLPIKWTAPEALKYNKFSNKSDMWSFGILLWEIYSFGRVPYPRIPLAEVVRHVERGYRMEAPEGCPAGPYDVMRGAWHADPAQRPTFANTRRTLAAIRDQALAAPQPPAQLAPHP